MQRKYWVKVAHLSWLAGVLFFAVNTRAAEFGPRADPTYDVDVGHRHWAFAGVDAGYHLLRSDETGDAATKQGYKLGGKLLYSHYRTNWVFDLGLGWFYDRIGGDRPNNTHIRIRTWGLTAEFSPRYRLTEHWQLGLVLDASFGTDVNLAPVVGSANRLFEVGAQGLYEWSWPKWKLRAGARVLTDLNSPERMSWVFQGLVQVGIPFGGARSYVSQDGDERPDLSIDLQAEVFYFPTGKAQLGAEASSFVSEVAQALGNYDSAWRRIVVGGHTDNVGSFEFNQGLSERRAAAVRVALVQNGIEGSRLSSKGYSYSRPVDSNDTVTDRGKNRRVELRFFGVQKNALELKAEIDRIKAKYER